MQDLIKVTGVAGVIQSLARLLLLVVEAVQKIKQTDLVVALAVAVVGLAALLLLVALETLHLFRQAKETTVVGIAETYLLHIRLVVEVAQAQWVEVVLVLLVERVVLGLHHLYLVRPQPMLVVAEEEISMAGQQVQVDRAAAVLVLHLELQMLEQPTQVAVAAAELARAQAVQVVLV